MAFAAFVANRITIPVLPLGLPAVDGADTFLPSSSPSSFVREFEQLLGRRRIEEGRERA